MSGAVAAAAPSPPPPQKLDELMLAMDVVDTIRHRELLVERELEQGTRDDQLRDRLREIYKGQGIEVPDRVIDEGIKALKESRFVYVPPKPGLAVSLATVWINRARILWTVFSIVLALVVVRGGYYMLIERPAIVEAQELPQSLDAAYAAVLRDAKVAEAKTQAAQALADGKAALARGDHESVKQDIATLTTLDAKLLQTYDLMIVSDEDEDSGVIRTFGDGRAQNYYLIVEALDASGNPISMDILDQETSRSRSVESWGVRVSEETFEQVRRDKADDGIVDNRKLGEKLRGELQVKYLMPVLGGAITRW